MKKIIKANHIDWDIVLLSAIVTQIVIEAIKYIVR